MCGPGVYAYFQTTKYFKAFYCLYIVMIYDECSKYIRESVVMEWWSGGLFIKCWPIIEIRRSCLLYPSLVPMYAYRIKNWSCFGFRLSLIRFIINWYSENGCKISSIYVGSLSGLATHHLSYWPKICDSSSNFFFKYVREICRILSISVSAHGTLVKYYVRC